LKELRAGVLLLAHEKRVGDITLDGACVLHDDLPYLCRASDDAEDGPEEEEEKREEEDKARAGEVCDYVKEPLGTEALEEGGGFCGDVEADWTWSFFDVCWEGRS
jgi:hypothetical protein